MKNILIKKKATENMCIHMLALMLNFPILYELYIILYENEICKVNSFPPISSVYINIFFVCISVILIIKSKHSLWFIKWGAIYGVLLLISCFMHKELLRYVPRAIIYFLCCVLCIAGLFRQISNASELLHTLEKYIPVSLVYAVFKYIYFDKLEIYDMGYTYHIAIPLLVILVKLFYEKKTFLRILSLGILILVNFKYGSRGCYVYCFVAILLIYFSLPLKERLLTFLMTLIIIFGINLVWNALIGFLVLKFPDSRNVRLLASGLIFYSAGRENIYYSLIKEFMNNPLHFRGIFSDRFLVARYYGKLNTDDIWGCYAHNIFIEMIYQYGIIVVPFIIGYIKKIVIIYRHMCYEIVEDKDKRILFIIFVSFALAQLSISSSYLIASSFGGLVGVIYMCNTKSSIKKTTIKS